MEELEIERLKLEIELEKIKIAKKELNDKIKIIKNKNLSDKKFTDEQMVMEDTKIKTFRDNF